MNVPLPPTTSDAASRKLKGALARVPHDLRDDAVGEAWVAHLSGEDPAKAIGRFSSAEKRYRQHHITNTIDQQGQVTDPDTGEVYEI